MNIRYLIVAFGLFICTLVGLLMYEGLKFYREIDESALLACINSMQDALMLSLKKEEVRKVINPNKEWKTLNKDEQEFLLNSIDKNKRVDCNKSYFDSDGNVTINDDMEVLVRQTGSNLTEVLIRKKQ
jgi:hypothetical protein